MKRFLTLLCVGIVFSGLINGLAVGQGIPLPELSTLPARPLSLDTTISRVEFSKLDLARKTLLSLSFAASDSLFAMKQTQLTGCEQALQAVVSRSNKTIKLLSDSLQTISGRIQQTVATSQATSQSVSQAQGKVSNFGTIIRDAKRLSWTARIGALGIGVVVGVLLPPAIKLLTTGL